MEQPNITSDGEAALTPVFWAMVAATGVATGLFGDLMMWLLFNVQYLAFGYHTGSLQHGVEQASGLHRVASLLIAGAFGGVARYLLRRHPSWRSASSASSGSGTRSYSETARTWPTTPSSAWAASGSWPPCSRSSPWSLPYA
jgi:hypothetical protein